MTCRCKVPQPEPMHGVVKPCDSCDSCKADSNVRLCAFTVPTLEEGRYYKNSFVFVEDENTTYYIDGNRSEVPFGSRPLYINDFDPDAPGPTYKRALIYDLENKYLYIYDANGDMLRFPLSGAEVKLNAGEGIVITEEFGEYTISTDGTLATKEELEAEAKTRQLAIGNLEMQLTQELGEEAIARTAADQGLQSQIDSIVNSSDVKDVVGTKAELDSYDTSTLGKNDIVKVLQDESEDNATTYYRWDGTKFDLVGEIGPYYTKGEIGSKIVTDIPYTSSSIDNVFMSVEGKDLSTGKKTTNSVQFPVATETVAGALKAADFKKFNDAATQTETNTQDISEALGQIAALDADKLGIESLLEGTGVTITKEGEGRETKLMISAEGGGIEEILTTDPRFSNNLQEMSTKVPRGLYKVVNETGDRVTFSGTTAYGNSLYLPANGGFAYILFSRSENSTINRVGVFGAWDNYNDNLVPVAQTTGISGGLAVFHAPVNNLTSSDPDRPLSANQGRVLKEMIEQAGGGGGAHELTKADYNWNYVAQDTTEPLNSVALWLLPDGMYHVSDSSVSVQNYRTSNVLARPASFFITTTSDVSDDAGWKEGYERKSIIQFGNSNYSSNSVHYYCVLLQVSKTGYSQAPAVRFLTSQDTQDNLTNTSKVAPLSANQGKLLNDRLTALEQGGGSGVEVVQETGTSTTAVMSQKAVTDIVEGSHIAIGRNARSEGTNSSTALGAQSSAAGDYAIGIGFSSNANNYATIAIGSNTTASSNYTIAIGYGARASRQGQFDIGSGAFNYGYNNSNYRLLTGLYDPQDDHDAATKGYVDQAVAGAGAEVTQEPGGSTTSVMSQDAATKLIYTNTTDRNSVKIGNGANGGADSLRSVTIGKDATTTNNRGTALGTGTMVSGDYAVALGAGSTAATQGELSVGGNGLGTNGYDGTNTRLITNVHDPVNAQDAATKHYVDANASKITLSSTDPGEGAALAAGEYLAVYGDSSGSVTTSDLAASAVTGEKVDWSTMKLNPKFMQTGSATASFQGTSNPSGGFATVTFPTPFPAGTIPLVLTNSVLSNGYVGAVMVTDRSNTGFTYLARSSYANTDSARFDWVAINFNEPPMVGA